MSLPPDVMRKLARVAHAGTRSFTALVDIAGLDKTRAFRGADLRRVDFGTDDLSGYDFTGADLREANLSRARGTHELILVGARLNSAKFAQPPPDFDLDKAHRMILAGNPPPTRWLPFIRTLLFIDERRFEDLSPLSGLFALQTLSLDGTRVNDLSPLAGLSALHGLWLNGTRVSDLSPLAGLSALQRLGLNNTDVNDLSPLAKLPGLLELSLDGTGVRDLSPLASLNKLTVYKNGKIFRPAELAHRPKRRRK